MVEGGAEILSMFMHECAAQHLRLAIAPVAVGFGTRLDLLPMERFALQSVEQLGDTAVLNFELGNAKAVSNHRVSADRRERS